MRTNLLRTSAGFTIIELMVTIAVLGAVLAIGLPDLREFLTRGQVSTITTEFASDASRARAEAINRNSCVTMCMSSNTSNALSGGTPTCATTGQDWQAGWIVFANPSCSGSQNSPITNNSTLIAVRQKGDSKFTLQQASGSAFRRITFDSRGLAAGVQKNLSLIYNEDINSVHDRSICLSSAGRITIKTYGGTSACP
jgi:type IV fimbrial biogenesis protein FimT